MPSRGVHPMFRHLPTIPLQPMNLQPGFLLPLSYDLDFCCPDVLSFTKSLGLLEKWFCAAGCVRCVSIEISVNILTRFCLHIFCCFGRCTVRLSELIVYCLGFAKGQKECTKFRSTAIRLEPMHHRFIVYKRNRSKREGSTCTEWSEGNVLPRLAC